MSHRLFPTLTLGLDWHSFRPDVVPTELDKDRVSPIETRPFTIIFDCDDYDFNLVLITLNHCVCI